MTTTERRRMELCAGFNAEELAMMYELLRLLLEEDDISVQHPEASTHPLAPAQGGHAAPGPTAAALGTNTRIAETPTDAASAYPWSVGAPDDSVWDLETTPLSPELPFAMPPRVRTRSNVSSDDGPILKRSRGNGAAERIPFPGEQWMYRYA